MRLGFIGLGQMGRHMARNLLEKSGEALAVFDVSPAAYPQFRAWGAETLERAEDISGCELIFLSLPGTETVRDTIHKLLDRSTAGQIVVDLSAIGYLATLEIAKELADHGIAVAMITDGRFSGASRGPCVGHICPEAYEGGPIALVEDGDLIEIDLPRRAIELKVSAEELARRKAALVPRRRPAGGVLAAYRRQVESASRGALWLYPDDGAKAS